MSMTVEERARQYATNHVGPYECGAKGDEWDSMYDEYIEIANEQKEADIEKACKWLRVHLPRVISNYPFGDERIDMLNEDMREDFKKAMKEQA